MYMLAIADNRARLSFYNPFHLSYVIFSKTLLWSKNWTDPEFNWNTLEFKDISSAQQFDQKYNTNCELLL